MSPHAQTASTDGSLRACFERVCGQARPKFGSERRQDDGLPEIRGGVASKPEEAELRPAILQSEVRQRRFGCGAQTVELRPLLGLHSARRLRAEQHFQHPSAAAHCCFFSTNACCSRLPHEAALSEVLTPPSDRLNDVPPLFTSLAPLPLLAPSLRRPHLQPNLPRSFPA